MRRKTLLLFSLIMLCLSTPTHAQLWSGILDPSRAIDWSKAGVAGGIPARTTICSTLNPGATAVQINSAISTCPSGQVVKLNAGTYILSSGIDFAGKSNVTLRGAGPDQTFLVFSGGTSCHGLGADICIGSADLSFYIGGPSFTANWTAGYAKGTTQITLSSTTGLAVGSIITLDQLNDSSDDGTIFICETATTCADEGPASGERTNRAQQQLVKVTAINGSVVTISPGLYMPNWRSGQSPGAFWGNATGGVIFGAGVEDLSADHVGSGTSIHSGIYLFAAYNCWVKNVRSVNANRNHVWLYQSAANTVRDSYFYGTLNAASQSYGVESYMSSDNLIENNIFQHVTAPMMNNASASGSVFGYNFAINDFYTVSPSFMQASNYHHAAGLDMVLHEGNDAIGFEGDLVHGTHHFLTAFRNVFPGWEPTKTSQTIAVNLYAFSRHMNIVGNILGTAGYHTNYQYKYPGPTGTLDSSIYAIGRPGNIVASDNNVGTTLMRWGNYDTVTGAVQWNASEVPSGLSKYANPVPATNNLPASFYLSSKPSWWRTIQWPAIGPDVTSGDISGIGGHAYRNPAHVCYDNTLKVGGILTFNANTCYGITAPGINPPKNLRIQ